MARGRHARRSALLAWLVPAEAAPPSWRTVHAASLVRLSDDVRALQTEVARLGSGAERSTATSTAAEVAAELRAQRLEEQLTQARAEIAALRADVDAVREELVWAFAERRLPPDRGAVVGRPRSVASTR